MKQAAALSVVLKRLRADKRPLLMPGSNDHEPPLIGWRKSMIQVMEHVEHRALLSADHRHLTQPVRGTIRRGVPPVWT
jgi:hypothetical protein